MSDARQQIWSRPPLHRVAPVRTAGGFSARLDPSLRSVVFCHDTSACRSVTARRTNVSTVVTVTGLDSDEVTAFRLTVVPTGNRFQLA